MIFEAIGSLFVNVAALSDWRYWVMWAIGGLLCAVAAIAVGSFVKDQPNR